MKIVGDNYERHQIYNDVYEYICEEGYHFESCGFNYGRHIYGSNTLSNNYVIVKDKEG